MVCGCCVQVNASGPAAIESLSEVNDKARISVWPRSDHDIPSGSELSAAPPPQQLPAASGAAAPARAEPIPWPPKPEGADGAPLRTSNVLPVAQSASVWQFRLRGEWKDFSAEEQVELSAGPLHDHCHVPCLHDVGYPEIAGGLDLGLFAAIPAVMAYNRFSARSQTLIARYYAFANELQGRLHRRLNGVGAGMAAAA